MAILNPDEKQLSIILFGNFNPIIFHPQWFVNHDIISAADFDFIIEQGDVLTHTQVAQFKSSWFHLEVTESRLQIICTQEAYFEMILDFLTSTFSVLHHTPIKQMGININIKQRFVRSEDVKRFVQKYFSTKAFKEIDNGAQAFTVKLEFNDVENKIGTVCNFEVSKITDDTFFMNVNQHYELGERTNGKDLVQTIGKSGRKSINANDQVLKKVLKYRD